MKKLFFILLIPVISLTSCSNYHDVMVTGATNSLKQGEAKKVVWFNIAFNVDVSAAKAAKDAGITKISTVEYSIRKFGTNPYTYVPPFTPGMPNAFMQAVTKKFAIRSVYITRVSGE